MTAAELASRLRASRTLRRIAALAEGSEVYLVGGALRDRALGVTTRDLDLVVEGPASPLARRLARELGGFAFPLGKEPEITWRVAAGDHHLDVWQPTTDLASDIRRRDFTVNALLWRLPSGPLVDLVGGLDDLDAGRLDVIRAENLLDDPLRVLRGLRLESTRPQLMLTSRSGEFLAGAASALHSVARERVIAELHMLMAGPAIGRALRDGSRLGILETLFPSWRGFEGLVPLLRVAAGLAQLQREKSRLSLAATTAASAVLAAPAAAFPVQWRTENASAELQAAGYPARWAREASRGAAIGEALAEGEISCSPRNRELAVQAGPVLEVALAWAVAGVGVSPAALKAARELRAFHRRMATRPALLDGATIAELFELPEGPARAEAVEALRLARARGEVRSRRQAMAFLSSRLGPAAEDHSGDARDADHTIADRPSVPGARSR